MSYGRDSGDGSSQSDEESFLDDSEPLYGQPGRSCSRKLRLYGRLRAFADKTIEIRAAEVPPTVSFPLHNALHYRDPLKDVIGSGGQRWWRTTKEERGPRPPHGLDSAFLQWWRPGTAAGTRGNNMVSFQPRHGIDPIKKAFDSNPRSP